MAKKAELLEQAKKLGLSVSAKNTIAQIEAAIAENGTDAAKAEADPTRPKPVTTDSGEKTTAKAGKRSAKGQRETEAKAAKAARKEAPVDADKTETDTPKRGPVPKTRTRLERRGKKYRTAAETLKAKANYELSEAVALAIKTATTKFDSTVELHLRLNVDPKQSDQNIREMVVLPSGSGKSVRVAVFAPAELQADASKAGADIVGEDELLDRLKQGQLDFDVLIATPAVMSKLGQFAKTLGPKGLMPNPKSGTVTNNVAQAVKQAKAGRVELRVDKQGIIHLGIGKVSFGSDKLLANAQAVIDAVKAAKPASVKVQLIQSAYITTSMGPSIRVQL